MSSLPYDKTRFHSDYAIRAWIFSSPHGYSSRLSRQHHHLFGLAMLPHGVFGKLLGLLISIGVAFLVTPCDK